MADAPKVKGFFERGGSWVLVQFVLLASVIVSAAMFHESRVWPVAHIMGIALIFLSAVFGIPGVWILGRNCTPVPHPRDDARLIETGIYARVRHPLYTCVILASFGWALMWASWVALVPALGMIPFFCAKVRREEAWLREKYPNYANYARQVPGFIPRIRRVRKPK